MRARGSPASSQIRIRDSRSPPSGSRVGKTVYVGYAFEAIVAAARDYVSRIRLTFLPSYIMDILVRVLCERKLFLHRARNATRDRPIVCDMLT